MKERNSKITTLVNKEFMDGVKAREALFRSVMDNLKPFNSGIKKKVTMYIGLIPLDLLFVDERYQCLRKHKRLSRLIKNWDERKLLPINIVPHPEENRFAIVDGQGRYLAAKELGYHALQAIVLMDAPENVNERLKFEAECFIGQDAEVEAVKPLEKHPARVIIGDPAALILEEMFIKYNIDYTDRKGCRKSHVLGSYPTTYNMANVHGYDCLDFIFSIIQNAGWDMESNGYATYITESLKDVWVSFPRTDERNMIHNMLSEEFRKIDPLTFSSKSRVKYDRRNSLGVCCRLYVEDMVIEKLGLVKPLVA